MRLSRSTAESFNPTQDACSSTTHCCPSPWSCVFMFQSYSGCLLVHDQLTTRRLGTIWMFQSYSGCLLVHDLMVPTSTKSRSRFQSYSGCLLVHDDCLLG